MKVFLSENKNVYVYKKGAFKPKEIVPFLKLAIERQAVILATKKRADRSRLNGYR